MLILWTSRSLFDVLRPFEKMLECQGSPFALEQADGRHGELLNLFQNKGSVEGVRLDSTNSGESQRCPEAEWISCQAYDDIRSGVAVFGL